MITYINPERYKAIPIEKYDELLASKDDYILDVREYTYESLDGKFKYIPTAKEFMMIELAQLEAEDAIEKELIEELNWG